MALKIENEQVVKLVDEMVALTGETKVETVRRALEERRQRLARPAHGQNREARLRRFLEQEVWPQIPPEILGKGISKTEEEAILGYGEGGA